MILDVLDQQIPLGGYYIEIREGYRSNVLGRVVEIEDTFAYTLSVGIGRQLQRDSIWADSQQSTFLSITKEQARAHGKLHRIPRLVNLGL